MHVFYYLPIIYEDKLSNLENFSLRLGIFSSLGQNTYFLALAMGPFMGPGYIDRKIPPAGAHYIQILIFFLILWFT